LDYSAFNTFFSSSKVDIPRCLLASGSSRRRINRHLLLKFSNYIMRKGKRQLTLDILLKSVRTSYSSHLASTYSNVHTLNWQTIFNLFSSAYYLNRYTQYPSNIDFKNLYEFSYNFIGKEHNNSLDMRNIVLTHINSINPLFSFYVYKVDKAIYKNSRGRSGKYTFIWKYLAPYKRRQLVLAWIAKEIKMQPGRTLDDRISSIVQSIYSSPDSLFINKVQSFSTNYVYRNARKSLCETYRTTTK
jgi:hypothetical protein